MYNNSGNSNTRLADEQSSAGPGSARVRHVPIRIESRQQNRHEEPSLRRHNDYQHSNQHANQQGFNNRHAQDTCRDSYATSTQPSHSGNDTSNINICYKPDTPQRPNRPHSSAREYHSQSDNSRGQEQVFENQQRARQNYGHTNIAKNNKENQESARRGAHSEPEEDNLSEKLVNSPEPIPLPGPSSPEPAANTAQQELKHDQQQQQQQQQHQQQNQQYQQEKQQHQPQDQPSNQQQSQQQQNQHKLQQQSQHQQDVAKQVGDNKKPKKDLDPLSAINSIRLDVSKLVQDIGNFEGASKDSKEYRYLDEMLTRCLLRLDSIQSSEQDIRQQRKSTVKSIELAADVLSKKAKLNGDMKELFDNLGLNASS